MVAGVRTRDVIAESTRYRFVAAVTPSDSVATWPNGSGNGLQSRVSGFDSRRRLQPLASA